MSTRRNVKIRSASFHKGIFLKGTYVEVMGKNGEQNHNFSSTVAVHPDLRRAFKKLDAHAIKMAELYDSEGWVPITQIDIIGFTLTGEAEAEGVIITLNRALSNGKEVNINTPLQKWDDQVTPYEDTEELSLIIEECKAEVYEYVFNDKHQPSNQLELGLYEEKQKDEV